MLFIALRWQQCRCNLAPFSDRKCLRVRWEHLDTDMVSARGLMRANPIDNSRHITPGDDGVDQPVTATIREVRVAESATAQVING
jgi:hypothetical protein